jgi:nitrogenase molybdenum-iron protein alpha/beta subunit
MVVVSHDIDQVKILRQGRDIIALVNDPVARRHGSSNKPAAGFEGFMKFLDQGSKCWLVRGRALVAVNL